MLYSAIDLLTAMQRTLDGSKAGQRRRFYDDSGALISRSERTVTTTGTVRLPQRFALSVAALATQVTGLIPRMRHGSLPETGCCEAAPCC